VLADKAAGNGSLLQRGFMPMQGGQRDSPYGWQGDMAG